MWMQNWKISIFAIYLIHPRIFIQRKNNKPSSNLCHFWSQDLSLFANFLQECVLLALASFPQSFSVGICCLACMSQIDLKNLFWKHGILIFTFIFSRRLDRNSVKIVRSVFYCFPNVLKLVREVVFLKHIYYSNVQVALGAVLVLCWNSALEYHVLKVLAGHFTLQIWIDELKKIKGVETTFNNSLIFRLDDTKKQRIIKNIISVQNGRIEFDAVFYFAVILRLEVKRFEDFIEVEVTIGWLSFLLFFLACFAGNGGAF